MKNPKRPIENWFSFINEKTNQKNHQIIPSYDLAILIEEIFLHVDCPLSGLEITITHFDINFSTKELGRLSENSKVIEDPFNKSEASYRIRAESKEKNMASNVWSQSLIDFLTIIWLPENRKHGQLDLKQDQVLHLLPDALDKMSNNTKMGMYCVFADLDHFGVINKEIGQDEGDKAIRAVLGCIESVAQSVRLICTIDGGDEYVFFIEDKGEVSLLNTLDKIKNLISKPEYGPNKLKVGITFGIFKIEKWDDVAAINDAKNKADQATKKLDENGNRGKNRGTVSFYEAISRNYDTGLENKSVMELAIALILSRQNCDTPFSNAFLNFISNITFNFFTEEDCILTAFNKYIEGYIKWLKLDLTASFNEVELIGNEHRSSEVSNFSFALAVAHGVLKSKYKNSISVNTDYISQIRLVDDSNMTLIWGDLNIENDNTIKIGCALKNTDFNAPLTNAVLVLLGSNQDLYTPSKTLLPHNIFADSIVVDGRPVAGGGLPDFWQAAMAQLISIISEKNIDRIIVYGDENGAPNITNLLKCGSPFDINDIVELSATSRIEAEKCMALLKAKDTVVFCQSSLSDVITALYNSFLNFKNNLKTTSLHKKPITFLPRPLNFPESVLPAIQGMKCATAAIAYPAVLEQLRSNDDDEINTYDNAEQLLKEIIGFKLILDTPSKESIPYYWSKSEEELNKYANNILISKSGLIGSKLAQDGQFDSFLEHLASYCNPTEGGKTSTRRAILIVPNNFEMGDMNPLGLVCIWVTPRIRDNKYLLDYCFVWRTVEALVGLPYSLYGSIQLAKHIRQELDKKFGFDNHRNSNLREGKLTYIALSLHMKTDKYNKCIAKSIVDAVSI